MHTGPVRIVSEVFRADAYQIEHPMSTGTGWTNTEFRTYQFSDTVDTEDLEGYPVVGDNADIVETADSRKRRGKSAEAPSREEQKALYRQGMAGWVSQNLQPSSAERRAAKVPEGKEVNGLRV
jgi:hypothetical protein